MNIIVRIIDCILILIISAVIASRYLNIKDEKTKSRVRKIIYCITIIAVIVLIIFLIYFCKTVAVIGTV